MWCRVRLALGLKPLKAESNNSKQKEQEAGQAKRDDAENAAKDAELRDRVQRSLHLLTPIDVASSVASPEGS